MLNNYFQRVQALFNPERFQGWGRTRVYFEGWYFKLVDAEKKHPIAIIPGIAFDQEGQGHAFIQVLDGKNKSSSYHRFSHAAFKPAKNSFHISINKNSFSGHHLSVNLEDCSGTLQFVNNITWPKSFYSPGIMGPFGFVPFMECYHGIVSMDHEIKGQITLANNERVDYAGGRGYIEKDWGRSFPSAYIWLQCNHFSQSGTSLKCSIAKIPWLRSSFIGFIAGFYYNKKLLRFTTYNQSNLQRCFADLNIVEIILQNPDYILEITIKRDQPTALASPILGLMDGRIEETMNGVVSLRLKHRKNGNVLLEEEGHAVGLEVAGRIEDIIKL